MDLLGSKEKMLKVKKHKKHKSEKKERNEEKYLPSAGTPLGPEKPSLKLILNLKVGGSSTPEHCDSPVPPNNYTASLPTNDEESQNSGISFTTEDRERGDPKHKKSKKKKKKKERERREKKHKHQHKEKRKRERDESSQDDVSGVEENTMEMPMIAAKKPRISLEETRPQVTMMEDQELSDPGSPTEPRIVLRQRVGKNPLNRLLDYLLKGLEKKDQQQFFAWPVTDNIAPGYSQIIPQPMDFSTIKQKLDKGEYNTLVEFMTDVKLMCNNAMVYNHPETIYYKSANKLLHFAIKMATPEKLRPLQSVLTYMNQLTAEELGFELIEEDSIIVDIKEEDMGKENDMEKSIRDSGDEMDITSEDYTHDEILEAARRSAKAAADKLARIRPNSKFGFLRQKKDGTTSLAILNPGEGITPGTLERPVSLGTLIGKLNHGTGQIQGYREDRRNIAKPIKPLYYGAFGSYAPSYDSTFANLTKEESDLVYSTYGNETGFQYAESIMEFAKDCEYAIHVVDELLDILTGGEHRKTVAFLEERKQLKEEEDKLDRKNEDVKIDINSLRSLADLGIDTSFVDEYENLSSKAGDALQLKLDETGELLEQLEHVQRERLCAPPPTHLAHVPQASEEEISLANKVGETLADMVKQVAPSDIVAVPAIRKAMGITTVPAEAIDKGIVQPASESQDSIEVDVEESEEVAAGLTADLESELREFLENDPTLSNSPMADDTTLEEMLCDP